MLSGDIERDIRLGYTGGAVDMYIPTNEPQELVYGYDVNSLYPSQMKYFDMPVGNPTYFEGDIFKINPEAFGFFYCKIITPAVLDHPIIQTHVKTTSGIRTIAPLGTWYDMLFSEELKNAIKYGYKFEIKWGYTFNRANVFKQYVDVLYRMRLIYPKSDPMNYTAKLLLNSLYGRFGMNDNFTFSNIFHKTDADKFIEQNPDNITNIIDLDSNVIVQSKDNSPNNALDNGSIIHNVNISIAAAITAYARIHMSQFKNNPNYKLFYSDTDSAYTNKPLDDSLVNSKILGLMKLESISTKAVFLAPKVYGLVSKDGDKTVIKAKGLTSEALNSLTINDLEALLFKSSSKEFNQEKWYKNISEGSITVKDTLFTLRATDNKRQLIYNIYKSIE